MTDKNDLDDATLRKRLKFRAWHRGTREMDFLMGSFADAHLAGFTRAQLDTFSDLVEIADPDLYNWLSGREPVPDVHDSDVMRLLANWRYDSVADLDGRPMR